MAAFFHPHHDHTISAYRVTVVGASEVGKTSLISAFVNNFAPTIHSQTDDPALHYKTIPLPVKVPQSQPEENEQTHGHTVETFPALVEIEDTYAWRRQGGKDCYNHARATERFLTPVELVSKSKVGGKATPVAGAGQMACSVAPAVDSYLPITHRRMAFVVVFDLTVQSSFDQALEILNKLWDNANQFPGAGPVVTLVANKLDKVFLQTEARSPDLVRLDKAREKAASLKIRFAEVSSSDFQKVKKLFRQVVMDVYQRQDLWRRLETGGQPGWTKRMGNLLSGGSSQKSSSLEHGSRTNSRDGSRNLSKDSSPAGMQPLEEHSPTPKNGDCALQ